MHRQLATAQTTWIKKAPHFHWLNMAPDGKRLSVDIVAKGIAEWFYKDTPLPSEWSGEGLKDAVSASNSLFQCEGLTDLFRAVKRERSSNAMAANICSLVCTLTLLKWMHCYTRLRLAYKQVEHNTK